MSQFKNLTAYQQNLAVALYEAPNKSLRTDDAARKLGLGCAPLAWVAWGLRQLGWVSSTNDGEQYQIWKLTTKGVNEVYGGILQEAIEKAAQDHARTLSAKAPEKWIVWCPESKLPPTVVHSCEQEAMQVAEIMARKREGQLFYAAQLHAGFRIVAERVEVKEVKTVKKLEQV